MKTKPEHPDIALEDIVFESKNKAYGAYELRKSYNKTLSIAIIVSASILLSSVSAPLIAAYLKNKNFFPKKEDRIVVVGEMVRPPIDEPAPQPPAPPVDELLKLEKTVTFRIIVSPDTTDQTDLFVDRLDKMINIPPIDTNFDQFKIDDRKRDIIGFDKADTIVTIVDENPTFKGGEEALMLFMKENIEYPEAEKSMNIQGTVYIRFVVEKDGEITNENVELGVSDGLNKEALRVVKLMPDWNPGKTGGKPVRTRVVIPVCFKLIEN